MTVVLFDIDGTLLLSDGAGKRAIHAALLEAFGTVGDSDHWFDGKTDRQIVRELMRSEGFTDEEINGRLDSVLDRYVLHLQCELADQAFTPMAFRGVSELLSLLSQRSDVSMGLLTGNVREGAIHKLRRVGIDPALFPFGAFGSDHEHRHELPAIAQQRASEHLRRRVPGESMVIIGDTPADVTCGRGVGARAIGVATGRYTIPELEAHSPQAVFSDLTDTEAVLNAILGV